MGLDWQLAVKAAKAIRDRIAHGHETQQAAGAMAIVELDISDKELDERASNILIDIHGRSDSSRVIMSLTGGILSVARHLSPESASALRSKARRSGVRGAPA